MSKSYHGYLPGKFTTIYTFNNNLNGVHSHTLETISTASYSQNQFQLFFKQQTNKNNSTSNTNQPPLDPIKTDQQNKLENMRFLQTTIK